jgi:hypothetical protein
MPSILENDAHFQYIKACSPYMKSNPYFSRVYEIVFKKFKQGFIKPSYHIEKLISIEEASDQMGGIELGNAISEKIYSDRALKLIAKMDTHTIYDIVRDISVAVRGIGGIEVFVDDNLNQAIQLIQKVLYSNPFFAVDMHIRNFMIRLGTTGPQLVITDPLQDNGASIAAGYNSFTDKTITGKPNDSDFEPF